MKGLRIMIINTSPIITSPKLEKDFQPIEIRPSFRTIKIKSNGMIHKKRLAFPYMQFFGLRIPNLSHTRYKVTWSLKSLTSLNDLVAIPILPNIYSNSVICTREESCSLDLCNTFWSSIFVPTDIARYKTDYKKNAFFNTEWGLLSQKAKHPLDVFEEYYNYDEEFEFYKYLLGTDKGTSSIGCYYVICKYLEYHESITSDQMIKLNRLFAFPCMRSCNNGKAECEWLKGKYPDVFKMENIDERFILSVVNRKELPSVFNAIKRYIIPTGHEEFSDYIEQYNWKADCKMDTPVGHENLEKS